MSDPPKLSPQAVAEMAALVAAVASRRDKQAFARLFAFYAPRIKSYLLRQGASESVAEELVQETLLAVWRKADMFDPAKASVGTWIFTIARNQRIDALRRSRRPEVDPADPALVPGPQPEPDRQVEAGENQRRIRAAMAQLSADQVKVIQLAFLEDKSHSEIAAALSLPLGTVKSRLRLAMQRIRAILDGS
jgi:RNA polymerase sigma-70 factor (ECF subfamily)